MKEKYYFYSAFGKQSYKTYPCLIPFLFLWNAILCFSWAFISPIWIILDYLEDGLNDTRRY